LGRPRHTLWVAPCWLAFRQYTTHREHMLSGCLLHSTDYGTWKKRKNTYGFIAPQQRGKYIITQREPVRLGSGHRGGQQPFRESQHSQKTIYRVGPGRSFWNHQKWGKRNGGRVSRLHCEYRTDSIEAIMGEINERLSTRWVGKILVWGGKDTKIALDSQNKEG